ncbi:Folate-binding protein YgfZ [Hyella patelloides LEGE 07179]|uniref:Folate-binding protein YgfZ n=1 Tax=Hyella patelloides LEGE 07179 TaxID=945734 RepID=A0A563VS28_9CYAN|nr:folate-binding protein YgfZ [Hyella patelloides]VEP14225.1 Folate-binding protein YgfZ [Hyella patelloides LEGE 07179]
MNYQSDKVSFCDRSTWGILQFTGSDRLRYLHNQSTNDFNSLKPGQGCQTVFVTSTARTLDLATAYLTEDAVLAIVFPNRRQQLLKWLDGFIFPFDKVKLADVSEQYALITLIGAESPDLIQKLFDIDLKESPEGNHQLAIINDITLRIAVGSDLGLPGYNLIIPQENAATIRSLLVDNNVSEMDSDSWEQLRILQGRPAPDKELTEDYNPLEAGLWHTISFDKGCYIGQETIARLDTYNGVKQKLWGVKLDNPVSPETPVMVEDKKVGVLTSCTKSDTGLFGLAYVRTKAGGAGLTVKIGEATGELVPVPFISDH